MNKKYSYNVGPLFTDDGYTSKVRIINYFNDIFFENFNTSAEAEILIFSNSGNLVYQEKKVLKAKETWVFSTSLLKKNKDNGMFGLMSVYVRLTPIIIPEVLKNKDKISTEFLVELNGSSGEKEIIHNTGGPVFKNTFTSMNSGMMISNKNIRPKYMILVNNYMGPMKKLLGKGFAKLVIKNSKGKSLQKKSKIIDAGGCSIFSFDEHFPKLDQFLDGNNGELIFTTNNLLRKPWIMFKSDKNNFKSLNIEHL